MALTKANKKVIFRVMAIALLALCAGFAFPESHYTVEKTYVKAPSPQAEIYSILCDDVEDSNDFSTGAHFFQSPAGLHFVNSFETISSSNPVKKVSRVICKEVYLLHRQFLI